MAKYVKLIVEDDESMKHIMSLARKFASANFQKSTIYAWDTERTDDTYTVSFPEPTEKPIEKPVEKPAQTKIQSPKIGSAAQDSATPPGTARQCGRLVGKYLGKNLVCGVDGYICPTCKNNIP